VKETPAPCWRPADAGTDAAAGEGVFVSALQRLACASAADFANAHSRTARARRESAGRSS
jgi:hypothetical protein